MSEFDSEAEQERRALEAERSKIAGVLSSPDWTVYRQHVAETANALIEQIIDFKTPEQLRDSAVALRALVNTVREFGVKDLLCQARCMDLEAAINQQRSRINSHLQAKFQ